MNLLIIDVLPTENCTAASSLMIQTHWDATENEVVSNLVLSKSMPSSGCWMRRSQCSPASLSQVSEAIHLRLSYNVIVMGRHAHKED